MNIHVSPQDKTIAQQRVRIEELEEEVRQLKECLVPVISLPLDWKLSATQHRLLTALYSAHTVLSGNQCFVAMESKSEEPDDIVTVQMRALRRKVGHLGIKIKNHYGIGYELPPETKAIIKTALQRSARA
jgi:DNA-binding response OmpR family regulator